MPITPINTHLLDTADSPPCARVRLMTWNDVSGTAADTDVIGFGEALAERSMR